MSPDEGQEEFDEVSEELRKREEVVKVILNSYIRTWYPLRQRTKGVHWMNIEVLSCKYMYAFGTDSLTL